MSLEEVRDLPENAISLVGEQVLKRRRTREKLGWYLPPENKANVYYFEKAKLSGELISRYSKRFIGEIRTGAIKLTGSSADYSYNNDFLVFNASNSNSFKNIWIIYFRKLDITKLERQVVNNAEGIRHSVIDEFKFTGRGRNLQYLTTSSSMDEMGKPDSAGKKLSFKNNSTAVHKSIQLVKDFMEEVEISCKS